MHYFYQSSRDIASRRNNAFRHVVIVRSRSRNVPPTLDPMNMGFLCPEGSFGVACIVDARRCSPFPRFHRDRSKFRFDTRLPATGCTGPQKFNPFERSLPRVRSRMLRVPNRVDRGGSFVTCDENRVQAIIGTS